MGNIMDFINYFETGEEEPIETKLESVPELLDTDKGNTEIHEGLIDVIFSSFRTNLKTSVSGQLVYFRWEWTNNKTYFTMRIKKSTFTKFVDWLVKIKDEANEEG